MDKKAPPPTPDKLPQRVRHTLRFRKLQVLEAERIAPHFIRITFGGSDIEGFASPGFDDHVKLSFPDAATGELLTPEIGPNGSVWPNGIKPVMRDYTPRHHDRDAATLAIDFALHEAGPATAWALQAKPGDWLGFGGPRGSFLVPVDFDWHLLIGDETALPAIARRLEELPATTLALVLVEVDGGTDEVPLTSQASLTVQWCHRNGAQPGTTSLLLDALAGLPLPQDSGYAWVACETAAARVLRAHLVDERGLHPKSIRASGYWRRGSAATHDTIED